MRDLYQACLASRHQHESGKEEPDVGDDELAVFWTTKKRVELYDKAVKADRLDIALDVIQGLEDRCFGKPRQQIELAGDPDNPLGLKVSPGFYRAQFADGVETPASAAAARPSGDVPPPARREGKAKRKRRS